MQNYVRSVKSELWASRAFHRLTPNEKVLYLYLLTGPVTSDTSVFLMPLDQAALDTGLSIKEVETSIRHFEELELVVYNWENEEICVVDYFRYGSNPVGGLQYEMYCKDFDKIQSKELVEFVKESAKRSDISMAFFAALQDIFPDICEDDYPIRKTEKSAEDMRNAAKRGRKKISERRKKIKEISCDDKTCSGTADTDNDLPF